MKKFEDLIDNAKKKDSLVNNDKYRQLNSDKLFKTIEDDLEGFEEYITGLQQSLLVESVKETNCRPIATSDNGIPDASSPRTDKGPGKYCNYLGYVQSDVKSIKFPSTIGQVMDIVQNAAQNNEKVKAVGNGHSYSSVSMTSGHVISLSNLQGEDTTNSDGWNTNLLKSTITTPKDNFISILGGTTIKDLIKLLVNVKKKALTNLGGADVQTLAGIISTGTHGSGLFQGNLTDMVRSVLIIDGKGECIRLEPETNTFTDPLKYASAVQSIDVTGKTYTPQLVQNDCLFYSFIVSMGCMGILYSAVIEVEDPYSLKETRQVVSISDAQAIFDDNNPNELVHKMAAKDKDCTINNFHSFILDFNPYTIFDSNKAVLTIRYKIPLVNNPTQQEKTRGNKKDIRKIGIKPSWIYTLFGLAQSAIDVFLNTSLGCMEDRFDDSKQKGYVDRWDQVLLFGKIEFFLQGTGIELTIPRSRAMSFINYVIDLVEKTNYYPTAPISIRFVGSSPAKLASMHGTNGETFCTIEIPVLIKSKNIDSNARTTFADDIEYLMEIEKKVIKDKIKLHWGLHFDLDGINNTYVKDCYGKEFNTWLNSKKELDPNGVFDNSFYAKIK